MAEESNPWGGHAPDLVRDNQLMHDRIAEQDREIERLRAALEQARSYHDQPCECSACHTIDEALRGADETAALPHVHLAKGGRDPDEKAYSARDVEALIAIALAASKHAETAGTNPVTRCTATVNETAANLNAECLSCGQRYDAVKGHRCPAVETTPQAPIANLVIDENGECSAACMYAPGLPPGEHDVYLDPAAPGLPVETPDGYKDAYYKIADLLGMSAMPISPKEAFEKCMLPRLRQLIGAEETAAKYGTCAVCGGVGGAHSTYCKDSPLKAAARQRQD